ncbi:MAG: iron-containing alcohol dehydrogenase, partial [Firmicutes bacterium]|nr:iron-containing alcohol dehydrogenase [Bacillota bacterium]
ANRRRTRLCVLFLSRRCRTWVEPNPSIETVESCYGLYQEPTPDLIIGLGGGSSMDVAKAVAVLATNGGHISDYEGYEKVRVDKRPLVAIPTTAGTGSEVTASTVITDRKRQVKMAIISNKVKPEYALVDPELTLTIPPALTASTGMDALTHAIESYVSKEAIPETQALALHAIRLIGRSIRKAVLYGDDARARDDMMMGSLLAGMAFAISKLGNVHAMAHPLGGIFDVPHGFANAIVLPYVMNFNALAAPELFTDIAQALGGNIHGLSTREAALLAVDLVKELNHDIGIPADLKGFGVNEDALDKLCEDAMISGNIKVNPRRTTVKDIRSLYLQAIRGTFES